MAATAGLSSFSLSHDDGPIWHCLPAQKAASLLDTSSQTGLRQETAVERLERFGPNRLPGIAARTGLEILTEQFNNLPVALLGVATVLSLVTGGVLEAVAIACVVGLNAAIGYATESEAERTINALTNDVHPPATAIRSGRRRQIPVEDVVPGDLIELTPGTMVAADARLTEADQLTADELALTGESLPVAKRVASLKKKDPAAGGAKQPRIQRDHHRWWERACGGGRDRRQHPVGSHQRYGRRGPRANHSAPATA